MPAYSCSTIMLNKTSRKTQNLFRRQWQVVIRSLAPRLTIMHIDCWSSLIKKHLSQLLLDPYAALLSAYLVFRMTITLHLLPPSIAQTVDFSDSKHIKTEYAFVPCLLSPITGSRHVKCIHRSRQSRFAARQSPCSSATFARNWSLRCSAHCD